MSISNPISLVYRWDHELALKAAKLIYTYEFKNSMKRYIGWLFIAMAQFGVVGALKHDAYGMLIVSTFLLLYWYGLRWPLRRMALQRRFEKDPLKDKTLSLSIEADHIVVNDIPILYDQIFKAVELEEGFLLYTRKQPLFIPKNSFKKEKEIGKCREIFRQKIVGFEDKRS